MNKMQKKLRGLTRGALVGALYVALTYLSALMGLSSGAIQVRFSEALCILPLFMPEAIPGLFIGCFIANLVTGGVILDVIFGSIATLIGAVGAYLLRKIPEKVKWLATLPTILANALIVPPVLIYAYGVEMAYPLIVLTVALGEIISCGVIGTMLYYSTKKLKIFK